MSASHSPQRSRRTQDQQAAPTAGGTQNREGSPSPPLRERPRPAAYQSMPVVPSSSHFVPQQGSQNQQSSPTIPSTGARRSPPLGQMSRLLPTPPHPNPPNFERRMSPPPGSQQAHGHYNRPPPRGPTGSYPTAALQHLDEYQMTPELLADIERADQQYQSVQPPYGFNGGGSRAESSPSGKGPIVDRVRGAPDRMSPDNAQQRAWQSSQRESPMARERPAPSPNVAAPFIPGQGSSQTPERRMSPAQHAPIVIPGEPHPSSYLAQFANREAAMRRATASEPRLNASMASQTPPLQNIPTRTPDRSLPVQEEDEVTAKNNSAWRIDDQAGEQQFRSPSPTPSSDLNPEGTNQRFDNGAAQAAHRDDDQSSHNHDSSNGQYAKRESNDEDGSHTPRSPTTSLPSGESFYHSQNLAATNQALPAPRPKPRNGAGDHIMLGLESTLQESLAAEATPPQPAPAADRPSYQDQRHLSQGNGNGQYQNYSPREGNGYLKDDRQPAASSNDGRYRQGNGRQQSANGSNDSRYRSTQGYPDEFNSYGEDTASAYIRAYLDSHSPRPDAPVPPTPHSQTAAPSPSPLLSGYGLHASTRPAGSPFPFPYNHLRRNLQMPEKDHASLTEQLRRQYQIYAQNHVGNITDSTLSPSSTPFEAELYERWADLHARRELGLRAGNFDAASIQSSPSHQPISLPLPPAFSGLPRVKARFQAKRRSYDRKPPPRVQSTLPRETSPELSSSGEETSTAGEERPRSAPVGHVSARPPTIVTAGVTTADDSADWIDEDEDEDYEDLIELEYHPSFVRNISKRRRKWEVGWENLIQAFQALDRQTDATMMLLASPSHSTKLHSLRSRSIRRQPQIRDSIGMYQIRSGFSHVAAQRRAARPEKHSLVDQLKATSATSAGDGSDGSSSSVEQSLRRALNVALESLEAMGEVHSKREMRVSEELRRSREDRERVEVLLKQVLGDKHPALHTQPRSAS